MKQRKYPLLFLSDNQEAIEALFADARLAEFFVPQCLNSSEKEDEGAADYLYNILTVHMTDQQLYSRFGYEVRAKIALTEPARTSATPYQAY